MKSFRIYLQEPVKAPQRVAADYSSDETHALQQRFAPIALRYRQHSRTAFFVFAGFGLCVVAGLFLSRAFWPTAFPFAFCLWFIGVAILWFAPRLVCPGCTNKLTGGIGSYCPECGNRAIVPGNLLRAPSCSSCHRSLGRSRNNRYRIRFCTYCGLMLDRTGLWR